MVDETIGRTHRFAEEAAPRLVEALLRVRDTASVAADKARETLADGHPRSRRRAGAAPAPTAMRRATGDTRRTPGRARSATPTEAAVDAATRATERLAAQVQAIADQTALRRDADRGRARRARGRRPRHLRAPRLAADRIAQFGVDRHHQGVRARGLRQRLGGVSEGRPRRLHPPRGAPARRRRRARDRAALRRRRGRSASRSTATSTISKAMLRAILAQRDGSPLGVTLLSSDMGKLYVALAQAIERLR